jgi:hypothetical protein
MRFETSLDLAKRDRHCPGSPPLPLNSLVHAKASSRPRACCTSHIAAFETPMLERNRRSGRGKRCLLAAADHIAIRTLSLACDVRKVSAIASTRRTTLSKTLKTLPIDVGGIHLQCILPITLSHSAERFHIISQITEDAFHQKSKALSVRASPTPVLRFGLFIAGAASPQDGFPRACILHFAAF